MRWVVLAAALAACTPYVGVSTATVSGPVIRVQRVDLGSVPVGGGALTGAESRAVAARVEAAAEAAPAALEITLVAGTDALRRDVEAIAARAGVPSRNVSRADGPVRGGAAVVLARWVALPPECRERALVGGTTGASVAGPGLGCAALVGLVQAVTDPRDLLGRPDVVFYGPTAASGTTGGGSLLP